MSVDNERDALIAAIRAEERQQRQALVEALRDAHRTLLVAYAIESDRRQSLRLIDAALAGETK